MFTPSLIPNRDQSWRPPLYELTPDDLQKAGWMIQSFQDKPGVYVARRESEGGGALYSLPCKSLELLYEYVRVNKIALQPYKIVGKEWGS